VTDTQKVEGYWIHHGTVEQGSLATGAKVTLRVDVARRAAITRNHSGTHLLHAALRTVLGTHVTQAGSLVAPDRLRFDFTHPQSVKPDELAAIEDWVNDEVLRNAEVETAVMDLEQARAAGAMALFGEKYDDRVRVVTIGEHSMELCGGIHVGRSAEIGSALVTQETSVAAGVRRIEMVTGGGSLGLARAQRGIVRELAGQLKVAPDDLDDRISALQKELRELRQLESERKKESGLAAVKPLMDGAVEAGGVHVVAGVVEGDDAAALRAVSDAVRKAKEECVVLLAGRGEKGAALLATATKGAVGAGVKAGDVLRDLAGRVGGKGGGRPDMAQGRATETAGLDEAVAAVRDAVVSRLGG
jgi:alanyl-tRNA synthetase